LSKKILGYILLIYEKKKTEGKKRKTMTRMERRRKK